MLFRAMVSYSIMFEFIARLASGMDVEKLVNAVVRLAPDDHIVKHKYKIVCDTELSISKLRVVHPYRSIAP